MPLAWPRASSTWGDLQEAQRACEKALQVQAKGPVAPEDVALTAGYMQVPLMLPGLKILLLSKKS